MSGYNTTELEDGYMEVSVLLYYPEEREELPEMPGAVPQRWHQPAVDAGSSRRRRSVAAELPHLYAGYQLAHGGVHRLGRHGV